MKLHVDLETLQLIEGPGFRNPVNVLRFKRGDGARLEVLFLRGGATPETIGDPASLEMHFGIKPRNRFEVGYLVHTADWTMPTEQDDIPVYQCSPSFNTVELDAVLGVGSPAGAELSEATLMGEITWRQGQGEPTSTRTFLVIVENDVNRGTEGIPTDADPPYPAVANLVTKENIGDQAVRHDIAQSLSTPARTQARNNISAAASSHTHSIAQITHLQSELNAKVLHIAARPESDPTFQTPIPILLHDAGEVWFLPPNTPQGDAILLNGSGEEGEGGGDINLTLVAGENTGFDTSIIIPAPPSGFNGWLIGIVAKNISFSFYSSHFISLYDFAWDYNHNWFITDEGNFDSFSHQPPDLVLILADPAQHPTQSGEIFLHPMAGQFVMGFQGNFPSAGDSLDLELHLTPTNDN